MNDTSDVRCSLPQGKKHAKCQVFIIGVHLCILQNYTRGSWKILLAQCFGIVMTSIMGVSLNLASPTVVGYLFLDFLMSEELFFFSVYWDFDNCVNITRHAVFLCTQTLVQSTALSNGIILNLLV